MSPLPLHIHSHTQGCAHPCIHCSIVLVAPHAHHHRRRRYSRDFPSGARERVRSIKREPMTPLISGDVRQNDRSYFKTYPVVVTAVLHASQSCCTQRVYIQRPHIKYLALAANCFQLQFTVQYAQSDVCICVQ